MPLVILEGPDGSGKSTLAARLLKGTGEPTLLVKRSGPPGEIETLRFQAAWIEEQHKDINVIADRHPLISETIYAPTVRKVPVPSWTAPEALFHFAQFKPERRPLVIYCRAPLSRMMQTSRVEDQMAGVHDEYLKLVLAYDDFMARLARCDIEIYRYDFSEDEFSGRATDRVKAFFTERE
jgi:deoxyadenosine/deoxycytidine kinase